MRRRMGNMNTGLGNPNPELFDNKWTEDDEFNKAVKNFFEDALDNIKELNDIGGFDFGLILQNDKFTIAFGIEPTYKHDPYILYYVSSKKLNSQIRRGKANGYYGSDIEIDETIWFLDLPEDFRECIDRHYDKLMKCLEK